MEFISTLAALDFGTSFSTIAYFDESGEYTFGKDEGNRIYIPSVFSCVDRIRIGNEAEQYKLRYPSDTINHVKRLLGRRIDDQSLVQTINNSLYKIHFYYKILIKNILTISFVKTLSYLIYSNRPIHI